MLAAARATHRDRPGGHAVLPQDCAFESVGSYDENVWIGEDVDFFWSLKKLAKKTGQRVHVVRSPKVLPSTRRFDKLPIWKVLLFTNPLFITLFRRLEVVRGLTGTSDPLFITLVST